MKKLLSVAAAVSLTFAMSACSKDTPTTPTNTTTTATDTPSTDSSTTSETPSEMTSETTTGTPTDTATTDASTSAAPAGKVDQSTPEAVMTSWLNAMVSGDSKNVCGLMATGGKAIEDIPNAVDTCGKQIAPMLSSVKSLGDMFKGLTITGATVSGNNATFAAATTTPVMAKQVISSFKAVKLNGKWYVTQ